MTGLRRANFMFSRYGKWYVVLLMLVFCVSCASAVFAKDRCQLGDAMNLITVGSSPQSASRHGYQVVAPKDAEHTYVKSWLHELYCGEQDDIVSWLEVDLRGIKKGQVHTGLCEGDPTKKTWTGYWQCDAESREHGIYQLPHLLGRDNVLQLKGGCFQRVKIRCRFVYNVPKPEWRNDVGCTTGEDGTINCNPHQFNPWHAGEIDGCYRMLEAEVEIACPPEPPCKMGACPPRIERCGDGILQVHRGEKCDDGNMTPGDGCNQCAFEECGDGVHQPELGEECDDGDDANPADGCHECRLPVCGDGVVQPPEVCDDGNGNNFDLCNNKCEPVVCTLIRQRKDPKFWPDGRVWGNLSLDIVAEQVQNRRPELPSFDVSNSEFLFSAVLADNPTPTWPWGVGSSRLVAPNSDSGNLAYWWNKPGQHQQHDALRLRLQRNDTDVTFWIPDMGTGPLVQKFVNGSDKARVAATLVFQINDHSSGKCFRSEWDPTCIERGGNGRLDCPNGG